MKVAIVHDWLTGMRGGERCLEVLCEIFPEADLFTLIHYRGAVSPIIENRRITTSFVQSLPGASRWYRNYLPLFPLAIERFDLRPYDLVISSSHCVAKGVRTAPHQLHLCYCYTPMRYAWDMFHEYRDKERLSGLTRLVMAPIMNYLRIWDYASSARVDYFVANSTAVARRIRKYYRRDCTIIPPPVESTYFTPNGVKRFEYYLYVSRLVRYKRADLAVEAFNRLGLPLLVVGEGPEKQRLERIAAPNVKFVGRKSEEALRELYRGCRALIFPQEEDFGIVPLEAQACGRPVIAYGVGGALDTVVPGATGVFFTEQSAESLVSAVRRFRDCDFDSSRIRGHACAFDTEAFKNAFRAFVEQKHREHTAGMHSAGRSGAEWHGANGGSAGAGRGSADRPEEEKLLVPGD